MPIDLKKDDRQKAINFVNEYFDEYSFRLIYDFPAIYMFVDFENNRLEYIGSTINFENRIRQHKKYKKEYTVYLWAVPNEYVEMREEIELWLVRSLRPFQNVITKTSGHKRRVLYGPYKNSTRSYRILKPWEYQ